jgi:hypothetical protein
VLQQLPSHSTTSADKISKLSNEYLTPDLPFMRAASLQIIGGG